MARLGHNEHAIPAEATLLRETSPALLALSGFLSACVTLFVLPDRAQGGFIPPLIYGGSVVCYLVLYERRRDIGAFVMFLLACEAAYWAAVFTAMLCLRLYPGATSGYPLTPIPIFIPGGFLASMLLSALGKILIGRANGQLTFDDTIVVAGFVGGILSFVGIALDRINNHSEIGNIFFLYFLWQTGTAFFLGITLNRSAPAAMNTLS